MKKHSRLSNFILGNFYQFTKIFQVMSCNEGDVVEFDVMEGEKGQQASNVTFTQKEPNAR